MLIWAVTMDREDGSWLIILGAAMAGYWYFFSWPSDYTEQVKRLEAIAKNEIGVSQNVWLVKRNAFGEYEKTTLVFGYMDDFAFCAEIAQLYMQNFPPDEYSCIPVTK
jgi:hypothetical protein